MDCRALQEAFRLQLQQPPLRLDALETFDVFCPLVEAHPDVKPAITARGDLCMVALRPLPAGTLLLREEPLAVSRCDPEDSSYNMLLLLSTTAKNFDHLKKATFGLMPRHGLPKEGDVHALFLQIIAGMKELVSLVFEAKSTGRSAAALCAAFEGLSQDDAIDIATSITSFCLQHKHQEEAADELMRLTVAFLLNSFAASSNEVRLCRFCALFNHSCDPSATPETEGDYVSMRLLRPVAAGEEITFCYVPLKQDLRGWRCSLRSFSRRPSASTVVVQAASERRKEWHQAGSADSGCGWL
ncbi:unnamed protein product [Durusdinium trenchii]|uniref:SET domain-containing protein n=1 Tax=Durusdinium trenchii TaxID=1381693 RepID=A0ABP0JDB4_9DINO